ncbi:MAG TPA: TetR/AcrR family transcriptional regulator C-terminal ligand-binding domain-containing protein [Gaiellaceae bacterium]|jgi:rhodanese-related sulfurtransferase|nr:TetR/AcrR family transcriptional regulator C-terminal ligand-binding domain-containing protein [Gaiellaceae bacterium]
MSTAQAVEPARRGRPRSERAHKAILEAAGELLLQSGLDAVGMDAIAMRAGVSKATIYRWWPTKESLALDAIYHEWTAAHPESAGSGSLRVDLYSLLRPWVRLLNDRPYGRVVAAILAKVQIDDRFAEEYRTRFIDRRRQRAREIMQRAIESGEIGAGTNVELALDLLYGPVYHRLLHGHAPLDEPFVRGVVDTVVYGLTSADAFAAARDVRPMTVDEVLELQRQGATVVDTRDPFAFGRAHLVGAVNVGLASNSYATWCGTLLEREGSVVVVADPGCEQEAAALLELVGITVEGFLDGGARAIALRPDRAAAIGRITAPVLAAQLASREPPLVLDVRTEQEWRSRHIGASVHIPLALLTDRLDRLPSGRRLVVHCAEGYRSAIAASLLHREGFAVLDLTGGIAAWQASGLETVGTSAG